MVCSRRHQFLSPWMPRYPQQFWSNLETQNCCKQLQLTFCCIVVASWAQAGTKAFFVSSQPHMQHAYMESLNIVQSSKLQKGLKTKTVEGSSKHKVKKDNIEMARKNHHNIQSKKNNAMMEKQIGKSKTSHQNLNLHPLLLVIHKSHLPHLGEVLIDM